MVFLSAELILALENSALAVAIRQSTWLYPVLEVIHLIGIALLAGGAFLFDLRLLGFTRSLPVSLLAQHVLPWSRRGLWLVMPSGFLLFITDAAALWSNTTFWLKMALLVVALINIFLFHVFTFGSVAAWEVNQKEPLVARLAAAFSVALWLAIITCGRWLAY